MQTTDRFDTLQKLTPPSKVKKEHGILQEVMRKSISMRPFGYEMNKEYSLKKTAYVSRDTVNTDMFQSSMIIF